MSRQRVHGQQPLPGAYRLELPPDDQVSFSRVVAYQAERLALGPIPELNVSLADPQLLKPDLVDIREPKDTTGFYETARGRRVHIALTPDEYKYIPHFPAALGRSAINGTLASRPQRQDYAEDQSAARRSGVHAVRNRRDESQKYLDESLKTEVKKLASALESIHHPGLRRKKGLTSSMDLNWFTEHHVGGMLIALREQRRWSPDKYTAAQAAIEYRLYGDREAGKRVQNWLSIVGLAQTWNIEKINLFQFKIDRADEYIAERQT